MTQAIQLSWRDIFYGVLIVLLAFGLRAAVVVDRAYNDTEAFAPLVQGFDQTAYYNLATEFLEGDWPDSPFYRHPGPIFYLGLAQFVMGDDLIMTRFFVALTGALTCGVLVMAGWVMTGRRWGGYLPGLLLAIYPIAIFFATDYLAEPVAVIFICFYLLLVFLGRRRLTWWGSLLIGLMVGLATINRLTLLLLLLPWWVYLWQFAEKHRQFWQHALISFIGFSMIIGSTTAWNVSQGKFGLVTERHGWREIYMSNNRDANGRWESSMADRLNNLPPQEALLRDILHDPLRFVELQLHKAGMYWSAVEPGNNINYDISGEGSSALLRSIPLDFRILGLLGLLGLFPLYWRDRPTFWFFAVGHFLLFISVSALVMEGRMRWPNIPLLVLSSTPFLLAIGDALQSADWRGLARRWAVPAALIIAFALVTEWANRTLPYQRPYAALPADVRPLNVIYDEKLELIGWRPMPDWFVSERGWSQQGDYYVVELFWRVLENVDVDYQYHITQVLDDEGFDSVARPIGSISHQFKYTSDWQPGEIYGEISGFGVERDTPPEISTPVIAGAFLVDESDESREVISLSASVEDDVVLQHIAFYDFEQRPETRADLTPLDLNFADQLVLRELGLPEVAAPGEAITMQFHWEAINNIPDDYILFVHVMDANNELAASFDGLPRHGELLTSTWATGYPIYDDIPLTMPETPGAYQVYIGLYNPLVDQRIAVDAPDYRPLVGEIRVE